MSDQSTKRIVEVFYETEVSTKKISEEVKIASAHLKKMLEHLTEEALVLLIWDRLPTTKRLSKKRVREVLQALGQLDKYLQKKEQ